LSQLELIVGIASLVLLISLFLSWRHYGGSATYHGQVIGSQSVVTQNGIGAHGYFWIPVILSIAVIVFIVLKAGLPKMPFTLPMAEDQALLIATGISFVLVLIGFFFIGGSGGSYTDPISGYSYHYGFSRSFGAYLSLIAALVAVVPLALPLIQKQMNKGSN
jgi:hypothetical protein